MRIVKKKDPRRTARGGEGRNSRSCVTSAFTNRHERVERLPLRALLGADVKNVLAPLTARPEHRSCKTTGPRRGSTVVPGTLRVLLVPKGLKGQLDWKRRVYGSRFRTDSSGGLSIGPPSVMKPAKSTHCVPKLYTSRQDFVNRILG